MNFCDWPPNKILQSPLRFKHFVSKKLKRGFVQVFLFACWFFLLKQGNNFFFFNCLNNFFFQDLFGITHHLQLWLNRMGRCLKQLLITWNRNFPVYFFLSLELFFPNIIYFFLAIFNDIFIVHYCWFTFILVFEDSFLIFFLNFVFFTNKLIPFPLLHLYFFPLLLLMLLDLYPRRNLIILEIVCLEFRILTIAKKKEGIFCLVFNGVGCSISENPSVKGLRGGGLKRVFIVKF